MHDMLRRVTDGELQHFESCASILSPLCCRLLHHLQKNVPCCGLLKANVNCFGARISLNPVKHYQIRRLKKMRRDCSEEGTIKGIGYLHIKCHFCSPAYVDIHRVLPVEHVTQYELE